MRTILVVAAACTALFTLVAATTTITPGWPSGSEFVVSILYWPAFAIAIITGIISLVGIFSRKNRVSSIAAFFLSLPMLGYGIYYPQYSYAKGVMAGEHLRSMDTNMSFLLRRHLLWYYELHPDRFTYIGNDDEVRVDGFHDFVKSLPMPPGWPTTFKEKDGRFIDPWGKPYRYFLDRDKDGYIRFGDKTCSVNGYADPWQQENFFYSEAVAIGSDHYDYIEPWTDFDEWIRRDSPWRTLFQNIAQQDAAANP